MSRGYGVTDMIIRGQGSSGNIWQSLVFAFFNHLPIITYPPTQPPFAAICLKQVSSWYHVIEVGNLNCRYNISKDEFSQQPRISSSAQSGLRWKQQCRCEVRAEKGENTAKKSSRLRQKLKCNVELNHFWQHAFIPSSPRTLLMQLRPVVPTLQYLDRNWPIMSFDWPVSDGRMSHPRWLQRNNSVL